MITDKEIKTLILSDEETFYRLVTLVTNRLLKQYKDQNTESYISEKEVMELLHVKSKTTISTYRNKGYLAYVVLGKRSFLYKKSSVLAFLKSRTNEAFGL